MREVSWEEIRKLRDLDTFPLVDCTMEGRYAKIYPLMQREVQAILNAVRDFDIDLIVFGSALTMRCNIASDLDICIRTRNFDLELFHEIQGIILRSVTVACDVIYYNDLSEEDRIREEIDRKGLLMKEMV